MSCYEHVWELIYFGGFVTKICRICRKQKP